MNEITTILGIWLILDVVALELISRRKSGMNDLYDVYDNWNMLESIVTKVYVIFHLLLFLPFTIPASIYKIIKDKKNE